MSQSDPPEPTRIGDYLIEGLLGAGGMAKVYKAKHAILDTHHAIKVLDPEYRANADARGRFLDEAKIQAKHLDHENIVKVTNIVATAEHAALVMELINGPSLESHIVNLKAQPAEITRIMLGVLAGVGYAHKAGIVHRDLKPANVLLAKRGDVLIPKVTDFGIAKVTSPDDDGKGVKKSTHAAARMGTLSYMSPEQVKRAKDATARSDVFSLGAMLYEMATGEMAFGGDSEYEVMENIVNGRYQPAERRFDNLDPLLASVIRKALETDPADRFASCEEMAAALRGEIVVVNKPAAEKPAKLPETPLEKPPAKTTAPEKTAEKAAVAVTHTESAPSSKKGLVIGLVVGALALGGGAVFLALKGQDSTTTTASNDGSGSSAVAAPADADVAMGADPDASAVAIVTPDAAAAVQPTSVDASVAVAAVPKPIDAGVAPKRADAGVAVAVAPKRVDAGVRRPDAAVVVASVPADAAVPAKPNPCAGNWSSTNGMLHFSFAATGCGGSYKFTVNGETCGGPIRGCRLQNSATVIATFSCKFTNSTEALDGSLSIICSNDMQAGSATASLLQGNMATLNWQIRKQ